MRSTPVSSQESLGFFVIDPLMYDALSGGLDIAGTTGQTLGRLAVDCFEHGRITNESSKDMSELGYPLAWFRDASIKVGVKTEDDASRLVSVSLECDGVARFGFMQSPGNNWGELYAPQYAVLRTPFNLTIPTIEHTQLAVTTAAQEALDRF